MTEIFSANFYCLYILFYNSHIFTISNCSFWQNNGPNLYHFLITSAKLVVYQGKILKIELKR